MSDNDSMFKISSSVELSNTGSILEDARIIIESSQRAAHAAVNATLVQRNWLLGKRIAEEFLEGDERADYGKMIVGNLSKALTNEFGKGFSRRELYWYLKFFRTFPEIVNSVSTQSGGLLSWTHYRALLRVPDKKARDWYAKEAFEQMWSARTLERNISTQYYHRLLMTADQHKDSVEQEMYDKTAEYQNHKLEFIKDPVIAEFLGLSPDASFRETDLENAILANLQKFLLELGKGYAFVARQQHIKADIDNYYIDLVFYNINLKCYVLIDLKTGPITHQDVGQMDMYVRMYDDLKRRADDNPTLGIVLCSETSETIAKYSVLHGNEQLFATKYKLYLPTEDELRSEIETQKAIFKLQQRERESANDDE